MAYDDRTSALASGELQPGERLLWNGRPDSTRIFSAVDVFLIPFGLYWSGITSFAAVHLLASGSWADELVLLPFVMIGIYLIFGRFLLRIWTRKRTAYAVTDRRLLVLRPGWRGAHHTSSVWLASHPPVEKRVGRDGRGTVWVGTRTKSDKRRLKDGDAYVGWLQPGSSRDGAVAFFDIPEAAGVAGLIARQRGELGEGQVSAA